MYHMFLNMAYSQPSQPSQRAGASACGSGRVWTSRIYFLGARAVPPHHGVRRECFQAATATSRGGVGSGASGEPHDARAAVDVETDLPLARLGWRRQGRPRRVPRRYCKPDDDQVSARAHPPDRRCAACGGLPAPVHVLSALYCQPPSRAAHQFHARARPAISGFDNHARAGCSSTLMATWMGS